MNQPESHDVYEFGGFRVDPRRRVLSRIGGDAIPLKPKLFDTLLYLVEHAGQELDKSTLLAAIWPNLVVEESNLNKTVSVLRRVLGETPDDHRFIVTAPGRGYRFVATVTQRKAESAIALPAAPANVARHPRFAWALAALAVAALGLVLAVARRPPEAPRPPAVRFQIEAARTLNPLNFALSPDGRQIAYVGDSELGTALWLRPLNSLDARPLPGTEGMTETSYPFWSPDGQYLAYRTLREIKRVDVASGATMTIAGGVTLYRRGAWGPDGAILYATEEVIHRVSAAGGDSTPLTVLDPASGEITHSAPSFLPDGKHFLYKATNVNRHKGAVYVGSLDPDEPRIRLLEASRAIYVEPGFIVYAREHALYARAFDAARFEFTGEAVQLADDLYYRDSLDTTAFDASNDGTLIYRATPRDLPAVSLQWVDRAGAVAEPAVASLASVDFRLSPDGGRIVFAEGNPPDVWTLDLERGSRTRLTADPQVDHGAIWSPDGAAIAFDTHRDGGHAIFEKRADGAAPERLLLDAGAHDVVVTDWSADGRFIVFQKDACVGCHHDIWLLPMTGEKREPFPYAATPFDERSAVLSPDGRWIAYVTLESGVQEVVVQSFPDPTLGKWQISANGGVAPRWSRDGTELYYYDRSGSVMRVEIATEPTFHLGEFVRVAEAAGAYQWDVSADGERLLSAPVFANAAGSASGASRFPITVILNWPSLLDD